MCTINKIAEWECNVTQDSWGVSCVTVGPGRGWSVVGVLGVLEGVSGPVMGCFQGFLAGLI